jgi:hypothetical protein
MRPLFTLFTLSMIACDPEPALEAPERALDTAAAAPGRLLDLTDADVAEMAARFEVDPDALDALLVAPFRCDPYGDLCAMVGPAQAEYLVLDALAGAAAGDDAFILQATTAERTAAAQADWEARSAAFGQTFGGSPSRSSTQTYSSPGGSSCYMKIASTITNWPWGAEHKAQLNNYCQTWAGLWIPGMVGSLRVCMNSRRTSLGSTATTNLCRNASNWDSASHTNTMPLGGSHTAAASGTISGANVTGSISRSVTATSW